MAVNGSISFDWGDAAHSFNIAKIKLALELEEKCGVGVAELFQRMRDNRWRLNDVREVLRLGLIGGGMEPLPALKLVERYCDERPWTESVRPAMLVLMAAMVGVPEDPVGKKAPAEGQPEKAAPSSETMADLSAPSSTVSEPPSDSAPATPTS